MEIQSNGDLRAAVSEIGDTNHPTVKLNDSVVGQHAAVAKKSTEQSEAIDVTGSFSEHAGSYRDGEMTTPAVDECSEPHCVSDVDVACKMDGNSGDGWSNVRGDYDTYGCAHDKKR